MIEPQAGVLESQASRDSARTTAAARSSIVFNPKGGVGKTTIAGQHRGDAARSEKGQRVLLVDCDTVTGHVASSLGMENVRTVADAWTRI